jgi:hypothetical protein
MEPRPNQPTSVAVEHALRDLQTRTLANLDGDFARLIYLASTRDYNSGRYAHDGLSFRFTEPVAEQVLAEAHRELFVSLALSPLKILVTQLEQYIRSGCARPDELLATWHELEPFRILAPEYDDPITVELFISNIRVALAIVRASWREHRRH